MNLVDTSKKCDLLGYVRFCESFTLHVKTKHMRVGYRHLLCISLRITHSFAHLEQTDRDSQGTRMVLDYVGN